MRLPVQLLSAPAHPWLLPMALLLKASICIFLPFCLLKFMGKIILFCFKAHWNQIRNWNPGPPLAVPTWTSFLSFFLPQFPHLLIGATKNKWDYIYKALSLVHGYVVSSLHEWKLFVYFLSLSLLSLSILIPSPLLSSPLLSLLYCPVFSFS